MTKETIKIQPMEEWLQDRIDLIDTKLVMDMDEGNELEESLLEEKSLIETILEKLTEE